ncbi:hypothetical protein CFOL_v3_34719 [Cephalotus follicularis]|uniref:Uncharacterized protein n=1 Tax=Cephalotus follicularis TaxID=3775 RepID=A0A1Q3DG91_CEPFO|nr:hypothetical protein CFOL_v3_34719 [Cephalotus follicularis]
MSSSSVNELGYNDLRYQFKYCKCGKQVAVWIMHYEKDRYKLYYLRENQTCNGEFLGWCVPFNVGPGAQKRRDCAYNRRDCTCNYNKATEVFDSMRVEKTVF